MIQRGENNIMTYQATVTEPYSALVLKLTASIDKYIVANVNIPPEIGIERRKYPEVFGNLIAEKLRKYSPNFFKCMVTVVEFECQFTCLLVLSVKHFDGLRHIYRLLRLYKFFEFFYRHLILFQLYN